MSIFSHEICENCMQIIDRACFVADFFKMGNVLQDHHHKVQYTYFTQALHLIAFSSHLKITVCSKMEGTHEWNFGKFK